jgi:signal peptidase II
MRVAIMFLTLLGCVGCDQMTKSLAREHLQLGRSISLIGDTVRLQYALNPGAFLGLGSSWPNGIREWVFQTGGSTLVGITLLWALRAARGNPLQSVGAAMICAGGLGNLIDRFSRGGQVTDFLNLGIGGIRTGIFNLADVALICGAALCIIAHSNSSITYSYSK